MKRIRATLVGALVIATAACSLFRVNTESPSPFDESGPSTIQITVDNQDFRDATLWANWNGTKQRIGAVTGKTTETFTTPWRDYQVRLEVDFIGGGTLPSREPILVSAGEHIDFIILPEW